MDAPITPDQAHARAKLAAMTALVDLRDWNRLGRCFADHLTLDYTSLWGGEAQEIGRDDLLRQWQELLPGFDATWHELGPATVTVRGCEAYAEALVCGTHIFDGEGWIVEGHYRCRLAKEGAAWVITSIASLNEREQGDRALRQRAQERI